MYTIYTHSISYFIQYPNVFFTHRNSYLGPIVYYDINELKI